MNVLDFSPGIGYRVFVPTEELDGLRNHIAHMSKDERERFAPLSFSGQTVAGKGEFFFVGRQRSNAEVFQFLSHVIIDH